MDIKKEVGKRIRMLREMKHITRETLCDDETDEVSNHTYGKAMLTWFEEICEEYEF